VSPTNDFVAWLDDGQLSIQSSIGLIDKGETPEQAAIRELEEETGYVGSLVEESPLLVSDPGKFTRESRDITSW